MKKRFLDGSALLFATCFFLSYIPVLLTAGFRSISPRRTGAGIIGTLFGALTIAVLPIDATSAAVVWLGAFCLSVAISDRAERYLGVHDDPRIVIDEWIGFWTAAVFLPRTWPILIGAFVLFRVFDVWKPGFVRRLARLPGGWGIIADDVAAGAISNLILQGIHWAHWF